MLFIKLIYYIIAILKSFIIFFILHDWCDSDSDICDKYNFSVIYDIILVLLLKFIIKKKRKNSK